MTPDSVIAALDRKIAETGETVFVRRYTGTTSAYVEVECLAMVRGYNPHEVVAGSYVVNGDRKVIISPASLDNGTWPFPPKVNDKVVVGGKVHNVQYPDIIKMADKAVRIEMQVR